MSSALCYTHARTHTHMCAYLSNSISSVHAAVVVQELVCLALSISQLVVLQYFCVSLKPFTVGSSITFSHLLAFELWTLTFSHTSLGSPSNGCLDGIDFDAHSQANTLLFKVAPLSCIQHLCCGFADDR